MKRLTARILSCPIHTAGVGILLLLALALLANFLPVTQP
jgi:hypothetical protein